MVCTPNKPEHARSRLEIDYNKMKEKYISKHQTKSSRTHTGAVNMGVLDSDQIQAIRNVTRLQNCLPDKLTTFCKKHLQTLLELDNNQDLFVECDKVIKRKLSTPFSSKKKQQKCVNTGLSKDTAAPIYRLISYLQQVADLKTEGLFRKAGNIGRQRLLKEQIKHGSDTDLQDSPYTAHDVANVLKQMISDLSEPLLTEKYVKVYLQIGALLKQNERVEKSQLAALQLMMVMLPQENCQLLKQLLHLLYRVASIPENKMTASSLGIVFAPSLLCPRNVSAAHMQADSAALSCVVSAMIENAPHVFDIPQELVQDVNDFWKTMEKPTKAVNDAAKQDSVTVEKINSDLINKNNSCQQNINTPHKTQMVLAKLYAHLRAMPQSAKKKMILKQNRTSGKPSNTGVKNEKLIKSRKLSQSLKQDLSKIVTLQQQEQCHVSETISQSCMALDRTDSSVSHMGNPYNKNQWVSRQKDSPAVHIVDLEASPYFTKSRHYWSCQTLDTVVDMSDSLLPGSDEEIIADAVVCKTLFTDITEIPADSMGSTTDSSEISADSPVCLTTLPSPISESIETLCESSRKTVMNPGSHAPVLIFQSPINRVPASFI